MIRHLCESNGSTGYCKTDDYTGIEMIAMDIVRILNSGSGESVPQLPHEVDWNDQIAAKVQEIQMVGTRQNRPRAQPDWTSLSSTNKIPGASHEQHDHRSHSNSSSFAHLPQKGGQQQPHPPPHHRGFLSPAPHPPHLHHVAPYQSAPPPPNFGPGVNPQQAQFAYNTQGLLIPGARPLLHNEGQFQHQPHASGPPPFSFHTPHQTQQYRPVAQVAQHFNNGQQSMDCNLAGQQFNNNQQLSGGNAGGQQVSVIHSSLGDNTDGLHGHHYSQAQFSGGVSQPAGSIDQFAQSSADPSQLAFQHLKDSASHDGQFQSRRRRGFYCSSSSNSSSSSSQPHSNHKRRSPSRSGRKIHGDRGSPARTRLRRGSASGGPSGSIGGGTYGVVGGSQQPTTTATTTTTTTTTTGDAACGATATARTPTLTEEYDERMRFFESKPMLTEEDMAGMARLAPAAGRTIPRGWAQFLLASAAHKRASTTVASGFIQRLGQRREFPPQEPTTTAAGNATSGGTTGNGVTIGIATSGGTSTTAAGTTAASGATATTGPAANYQASASRPRGASDAASNVPSNAMVPDPGADAGKCVLECNMETWGPDTAETWDINQPQIQALLQLQDAPDKVRSMSINRLLRGPGECRGRPRSKTKQRCRVRTGDQRYWCGHCQGTTSSKGCKGLRKQPCLAGLAPETDANLVDPNLNQLGSVHQPVEIERAASSSQNLSRLLQQRDLVNSVTQSPLPTRILSNEMAFSVTPATVVPTFSVVPPVPHPQHDVALGGVVEASAGGIGYSASLAQELQPANVTPSAPSQMVASSAVVQQDFQRPPHVGHEGSSADLASQQHAAAGKMAEADGVVAGAATGGAVGHGDQDQLVAVAAAVAASVAAQRISAQVPSCVVCGSPPSGAGGFITCNCCNRLAHGHCSEESSVSSELLRVHVCRCCIQGGSSAPLGTSSRWADRFGADHFSGSSGAAAGVDGDRAQPCPNSPRPNPVNKANGDGIKEQEQAASGGHADSGADDLSIEFQASFDSRQGTQIHMNEIEFATAQARHWNEDVIENQPADMISILVPVYRSSFWKLGKLPDMKMTN